MHTGKIIDRINDFEVIDCETCGFKHLLPIPSPQELESVYRQDYYSVEKPLYLERHREDLDWWNLIYGERYDTFEELLSPERRKILDVGSGPGFFLLHGKKRGWETFGIEPSSQAAAHCRSLGLTIIEGFLTDEIAERLGRFDVVHLCDVLEHIPDPKGILETVRHLLAPGGLVCVVVPNDYNPFQYILRNACNFDPWWLAPPHHINYFDFESMSHLLDDVGFKIVLRESTFPIDMFLLMGDNYIGNDLLGRKCHAKRKMLEQNIAKAGMTELKRKLYQAFASIGIGREVQIIAKKK